MHDPASTKNNAIEVSPATVAAITAALVAGGYITSGERITGIRRKSSMNRWKKSGIFKQMLERDLSIDLNSI